MKIGNQRMKQDLDILNMIKIFRNLNYLMNAHFKENKQLRNFNLKKQSVINLDFSDDIEEHKSFSFEQKEDLILNLQKCDSSNL